MPPRFSLNESVLIIKQSDPLHMYKGVVTRLMRRSDFNNDPQVYKVKVKMNLKEEKGDRKFASNEQFRHYKEDELIPMSRISLLLYA